MFDVWHLGVPVKNLQASVKFYQALGFELIGYFAQNLAFVRPPGSIFTLELMELVDSTENQVEKKPHHLAFAVENLQKFRERLRALEEVEGVTEIRPSFNGMSLFALKDPDGITIQFYQGHEEFERAIQLQK